MKYRIVKTGTVIHKYRPEYYDSQKDSDWLAFTYMGSAGWNIVEKTEEFYSMKGALKFIDREINKAKYAKAKEEIVWEKEI